MKQKGISKYQEDPCYFIEEILGIKLKYYQKEMLQHLGYFDLELKNKSKIRIPCKSAISAPKWKCWLIYWKWRLFGGWLIK